MNDHKCIVLVAPQHRYNVVEQQLIEAGLHVVRIREREALSSTRLAELGPRYVFFLHWPWKIASEVHERYECIIFHMTDVPFGRGGSPLQNLIVRGHTETKLSALRCIDQIDAGPVYLKESLSLLGSAEEILCRASQLMAKMILEIINRMLLPSPQVGEPVVFQRRLPQDGDISLLADLSKAYDWIRMLDAEGYPPAFLETEHFRLEFSRASLRSDYLLADVKIVKKT